MADAPTTPEELHSQVQTHLDDIHGKIVKGMETGADKVNHLQHLGWLAGPLPGVLGEIGIGKLVDNFKSMCSKVWEGFKTLCSKVWEFVGDVAGRPVTLMGFANQYNDLRTPVEQMSAYIASDSAALTAVWSGVSASAYTTVSDAQSGAVMGISQALSSAADLLSGAAESILLLWSNLLDCLVSGVTDIASKLTTLADLGKLAFADAGPIVDAMLSVVNAVWKTEKVLVDYVSNQATTVVNGWNSIDGGVDGLPGFAWPPISATTAGQFNTPGGWQTG